MNDKLLDSKETAWRVSKEDLKRNKEYERYKAMNEEMLEKTESEYAPWTIIEAEDRRFATAKIYATVVEKLSEKVAARREEMSLAEEKKAVREEKTAWQPKEDKELDSTVLSKVDLSLAYTKEEYKEKLKKLQDRMEILHSELYRQRIPVVLGFEGWDAGGKGGAIKRLTEPMDPRGYLVSPTASPTPTEKSHHYLWRFWKAMPKEPCRKTAILLSLTGHGTAELWWSGSKASAPGKNGRGLIGKSMIWKPIWLIPGLLC